MTDVRNRRQGFSLWGAINYSKAKGQPIARRKWGDRQRWPTCTALWYFEVRKVRGPELQGHLRQFWRRVLCRFNLCMEIGHRKMRKEGRMKNKYQLVGSKILFFVRSQEPCNLVFHRIFWFFVHLECRWKNQNQSTWHYYGRQASHFLAWYLYEQYIFRVDNSKHLSTIYRFFLHHLPPFSYWACSLRTHV